MDFSSLSLLAVICVIGSVTPSPDFVVVMRNSLALPRRQALATSLGVVSGCIFHTTYCILGLALIVANSPIVFSCIKYAGSFYLMYIGAMGIFSPHTFVTQGTDATPVLTAQRAYMQGFLCNVLNPKVAIFLLSLFTQFIPAEAGVAQKIAVGAVFVIEAVIFWPLLALLLQSGVIRDHLRATQRYFDWICGALLFGLGLKVALGH